MATQLKKKTVYLPPTHPESRQMVIMKGYVKQRVKSRPVRIAEAVAFRNGMIFMAVLQAFGKVLYVLLTQ